MTESIGVAVLCLSGVGGSGVVAADVAQGLAERGHRVHLISDKAPFRLQNRLHSPVQIHSTVLPEAPSLGQPPITIALASKLAEVVADQDLDVIHVHYAVPNAVVAQLARVILGPVAPRTVITLHGTDVSPVGIHPSYRTSVRSALLDAAALTAPSAYLAQHAGFTFDLPERLRVRVVPNFVDTTKFEIRAQVQPERPFTVIHVSNFRPVKRAIDAVVSFAEFSRTHTARLLLVGDGPDKEASLRKAVELGVNDRVEFLGVRYQVADCLAESDVALVPSGSESFGLSALEALAAGLPVVASRVGGLQDVVKNGETGFTAEVGDTNSFAAHLRTLADNDELRLRMGQAGRADAKRRFRPERALDAYEDILFAARRR